jgi:hypothetical protein
VTEGISADSLGHELVRGRFLLRLSTTTTNSGAVGVAAWRIAAFHLLFPTAAILAGISEATLHLSGGGRGVLDHYGFHALFLSAPVLTWMLSAFVLRLVAIIADATWFEGSLNAKKLQDELVKLATGRDRRGAILLALMRSVGVAAAIANASSTRYPLLVYGQDVWDSIHHPTGYVVGRAFLTYYWVYLLPLVAYFAAIATYATVRIALLVEESSDHELRCFAADGCGGFRALGSLMTAVVYMYVPIVIVVVALSHTHTNFYPTLKLSAALAILIPAQLFLPFIRLHRTMVLLKQRKLAKIEKLLTEAERTIPAELPRGWESRLAASYLRLLAGASLYQQTAGMTTWPYMRKDALKWLTPFIPLAVSTVVKRFVP